MITTASELDLDTPFALTAEHIATFRRDGYIKIKDLLAAEVLAHYRQEITGLVKELSKNAAPLAQRGTYGKAFLQVSNLWEHSVLVKEFVMGKRLARVAAELMGTRGVRMYHDQALYKEAGGGYTPWHVDQVYWPLSNENTVTAWIPLHAVPLANGPLSFSVGSQRIMFGRDLTISDESERRIQEHLRVSDLPIDETPFDLGEVSFHYGFTFHRAGPNTLDYPREVMTIIYMDSEMRLAESKNESQKNDWHRWLPGAEIGKQIDTPLNPVIYERE